MFSSQLPDNVDYRVVFSDYSKNHYIKRFEKDYKGRRWAVTQDSIFQQLKRVHALQKTQQVDELMSGDACLLFKYDFAVAQTNISAKASGNRAIVFLDRKNDQQTVLMVYGKSDLPKNSNETAYIHKILRTEFSQFWTRLHTT